MTNQSTCSGSSVSDSLGAFEWYCVVESGVATFYSFLKPDKRLRDLLDGLNWRLITVTLQTPAGTYDLGTSTWWTNRIVALPNNAAACSGGSYNSCDGTGMARLNSANTVYVASSSQNSLGYNLDADGIALVVASGARVVLTGSALNCNWNNGESMAPNYTCLLHSTGQKHLWIEGDFVSAAATAPIEGINFHTTHHSVVRHVYLGNFDNANMDLEASNANLIINTRFVNTYYGIYIAASSTGNSIQDSMTGAGNAAGGPLLLTGGATQNYMTLVTGTGSHRLLSIYSASNNNVVHNTVSVNNSFGYYINASGQNTISQGVAGYSLSSGVDVNTAGNPNKFTGNLLLGSNGANCVGAVGTGITNACVNDGQSNANILTSIDLISAFVGSAGSDGTNTSAPGGSVVQSNLMDWTRFDNPFRIFGRQFGTWGQISHCSGGDTCRIYDYTLSLAASVLRNMSNAGNSSNGAAFSAGGNCPNAVSGGTTLSSYNDSITYLKNAVELLADGRGNDNGLCESSENCLYTPNFGAYQGHGSWGTCSFTDGTISNVTMYGYPSNGR